MIHIWRENLQALADRHYKEFFEPKYVNMLFFYHTMEKDAYRKKFLNYLLQNNKELVSGTPQQISRLLQGIYSDADMHTVMMELGKTLVTQEAKRVINSRIRAYDTAKVPSDAQVFAAKIERIFSYSDLCVYRQPGEWCAYEILRVLQVKTCPYCNRSPLTTYESQEKKKRIRSDLDHFYAKYRFPFLAVSFFNLIPSCETCNRGLKSTVEFDHDSHLNPYFGGFDDEIRFRVSFTTGAPDDDYVSQVSAGGWGFTLEFERTSLDTAFLQRTAGNEDVFMLLELYNQEHKGDAARIIDIKRMYPPVIHDFWRRDFPGLTDDEYVGLHWRGLLGSLELNDLDKTCLSKLTRDLRIQYSMV